MASVYDVDTSKLVNEAAKKLKEVMKGPPAYVTYVKSGAGRERPPKDPDFWYIRSASILRQVYINGPVGISRLRLRYGNRKEHVIHKKHSVKASGSIIQDSLRALEELDYVKKTKKGREITAKGKSFMDKLSNDVIKS